MTRLAALLAALAVMAAATVAWVVHGRRPERGGSLTAPPCRHEYTWFDRTICAHGRRHTICAACGQQWPDCEPDDDVQPPDPRPMTLASGPKGWPDDATHWTVTAAGHESQTRVGDRG